MDLGSQQRSAARDALRAVPATVRALVEDSTSSPAFTSFLLELLAQPGRALSGRTAAWPRLVVETSIALGGSAEDAIIAGAAVDDGRGLPVNGDGPSPTSLGLLGMRERLAAWNATVTIENAIGGGVEVSAWVPLPSSASIDVEADLAAAA